MKKVLLSLVIIVIILGAFTHWNLGRKHAQASITNVQMVSIAQSGRYAKVTGEYPQFSNASPEFNAKIANAIKKGIEEHATTSKENWRARFETALPSDNISEFPTEDQKFQFTIATTTIVRNDDKVISLEMSVYEYAGGAHGMEAILTFNYDVVNKKEITIYDVMKGDLDFLKKLSALSRTMLVAKMAAAAQIKPAEVNVTMLNDGTTPTLSNFALFTLPSDTQATFYFTQYQVAAYVFGSQEITVDLPLK